MLEDSYNGVRAGAAGGFVTVMVPDMAPANDEMRRLYTAECCDLYEVLEGLQKGDSDCENTMPDSPQAVGIVLF